MPVANSRFSRPRATSPSASESTLPCSAVSSRGDLLAVLIDQVADAEHDVRALRQRGGAPGRECRGGGSDRGIDLVGRGEVDPLRLSSGRRVVNRPAAARARPRRAGHRSSGSHGRARSRRPCRPSVVLQFQSFRQLLTDTITRRPRARARRCQRRRLKVGRWRAPGRQPVIGTIARRMPPGNSAAPATATSTATRPPTNSASGAPLVDATVPANRPRTVRCRRRRLCRRSSPGRAGRRARSAG